MKNILRGLNQRPIAYYPIYKRITGSLAGAVLLSQLMYWFSKKDKFYKTDADIIEETDLSISELRSAKTKLKELKFIIVSREGIPAKTYYSIDWDKYQDSLISLNKLSEKTYNQDSLNSLNCDSEINESINRTKISTNKKNKQKEKPKPKKSAYEIFMLNLKSKVKIKSKVTITKDGLELFNSISNKQLLEELYIKHQLENGNYAKRITAFMEDWGIYEGKAKQVQVDQAIQTNHIF